MVRIFVCVLRVYVLFFNLYFFKGLRLGLGFRVYFFIYIFLKGLGFFFFLRV
jgi:hypothetical protein